MPTEISDAEPANVVPDERDGDHQRYEAAAVIVEDGEQLAAGVVVQSPAEMTDDMEEDIRVLLGCGHLAECAHELGFVALAQFPARDGLGAPTKRPRVS